MEPRQSKVGNVAGKAQMWTRKKIRKAKDRKAEESNQEWNDEKSRKKAAERAERLDKRIEESLRGTSSDK